MASACIEDAAPAQYLGFLNKSSNNNPNTHVFGVEFDVFRNQEFKDINDNHVSVNTGSLFSLTADKAGYWFDKKANNGNETYWSFRELKLKNGEINRAWIEYADYYIKVTMAPKKMKKPRMPLPEMEIDLNDLADEMYVGFCAATGQLIENHRILSWRFTN